MFAKWQFSLSLVLQLVGAVPLAFLGSFSLYWLIPVLASFVLGPIYVPADAISEWFQPDGYWFYVIVLWSAELPTVVLAAVITLLLGAARLRMLNIIAILLPIGYAYFSIKFGELPGWSAILIVFVGVVGCWTSLWWGCKIGRIVWGDSPSRLLFVFRCSVFVGVFVLAATCRGSLSLTYPELREESLPNLLF